MKESFGGFYDRTDEELKEARKDPNTIFVFDTNVLLNIYSYSDGARDDSFKVMEQLKKPSVDSISCWI